MSLVWSVVLALSGVLLGAATMVFVWRRRATRPGSTWLGAGEDFERLFERAPVAIALTNGMGRIQRVNERFTRLFGYRQADVVGEPIDNLIVPPELLAEARVVSRFAAGGFKEIPATARRRKDGRLVNVSVHCASIALTGEERGAAYSFYQDITDQKVAEDAVHERERLLELFFTQSLDGCFFMMLDEPVRWDDTVDKERTLDYVFAHQRITKVNDAMLRQYGATREHCIGRTPTDLFAHDITHGRAVWRRFFDAGRLHVETDERRIDGTPIRIDGDYICLYEERGGGRIVGHFGVQRDVTARYRTEEELRLSEQQLRELANRLQAVREAERRRIAVEIHDRLGQALTGIKLDLAWLERRLPVGDAALHQRAHGTLGDIDAAIESVKRISAELRPAVLDTLGLIAAIEWQAGEFTERTGIGCHLELPAKAPAVDDARSTALFRVMQEALTNVARHAEARRVDIRLSSENGHLVLEIADDGKGLGDAQTTGPRSLGIAGMRERLGAHGGRLRVANRQPSGMVLEARLPLVTEPAP